MSWTVDAITKALNPTLGPKVKPGRKRVTFEEINPEWVRCRLCRKVIRRGAKDLHRKSHTRR